MSDVATMRSSIWYSPFTDEWWMVTAAPQINRFWLEFHPDAIQITNAHDVLAPTFIEQLRETAALEHALAACGRCGRSLVVAINPELQVEFHYCPKGRCR